MLQGVCYTAWQAIGGRIGVLFLVVRWWKYWIACITLGEVKSFAVVALPATLGAGFVVAIWLSTLRDRRSLTSCDGLSLIMAVISAIVVACRLFSVAVLGSVSLRASISSVAEIIVLSCSDIVGTLQCMGITLYVLVFW